MVNHLPQLISRHGVEDVEEEGAVDLPALAHLVRHIRLDALIILVGLPDLGHVDLFIEGHSNGLDLGPVEDLLLPGEEELQEVLVDVADRREVVLH